MLWDQSRLLSSSRTLPPSLVHFSSSFLSSFPFVLHPLFFLCILLISSSTPLSLSLSLSLCSTYKIWRHSKI